MDVGANIGDTVLNIGDCDNDYLCVEGVEDYYVLLRKNLDEKFHYKLIASFCGEETCDSGMQIEKGGGTARVLLANTNNAYTIRTVDTIISEENFPVDVLKIDTDGFDFKVLRGAVNALKAFRPIVFFEWTKECLIMNNEDPLSIFEYMNKLGYDKAILLDNKEFPYFILRTDGIKAFEYALNYTRYNDTISYYDVCMIHKDANITTDDLWDYLNN